MDYPELADLALIGNRRTAAAVGRDATIWWYCPRRFDAPGFLVGLLDAAKGGWRVELPGATPGTRRYVGRSAVLETRLRADDGAGDGANNGRGGELVVTDWMVPPAETCPGLLCRSFASRAPQPARIGLVGWRDWGRAPAIPVLTDDGAGEAAVFADGLRLFASHPLQLDERSGTVFWVLPPGEDGWAVLADGPCARPGPADLAGWQARATAHWEELARQTTYRGPYQDAVEAALRQLRLLIFEPTGAVVAAATAGLPEVIGGRRNYDYRYAWLRDTGMVVRALLRTAKQGDEGDAFLALVARAKAHADRAPLDAVMTVDGRPIPEESHPPLSGYEDSAPVRIGNQAGQQLQLGALGGVLLAAASTYRERGSREHWQTVQAVADFLIAHWQEPDSGVWEAPKRRQYTASKVFAACGLEAIARFADPARCAAYRGAAQDIRRYVLGHCLTPEGAFAAFEGCEGVDVTVALFPVWSFCQPDTPEMLASIRVLARDYERDRLFRREDETPESRDEGAFLPATFWVAQYWASRGDPRRARAYIEAGLRHANDLGLLPEEVGWDNGRALGNLPLAMALASLLNAIVDVCNCEAARSETGAAAAAGG